MTLFLCHTYDVNIYVRINGDLQVENQNLSYLAKFNLEHPAGFEKAKH